MSVKCLSKKGILVFTNTRKGEVKLGELVHSLSSGHLGELVGMKQSGVKFCLLGIPESIGVLGNLGNPGTENAWTAFLKSFLNIQSNRFLSGNEFVVLGEVNVHNLQEEAMSLDRTASDFLVNVRLLCEKVDAVVAPIIAEIAQTGIIPIVIGGGHNNAYPILKGVTQGLAVDGGINAINLDAHADFRSREGRHSGNGFSYAKHEGFLNHYIAFGLHQSYNSEKLLQAMDTTAGVKYSFFEDINDLDASISRATAAIGQTETPTGIEVDMDAIKMMPSSAMSPSGFSLENARSFVKVSASTLKPAYLHLPEAAPKNEQEQAVVGKALSYLVTDFAKVLKDKK